MAEKSTKTSVNNEVFESNTPQVIRFEIGRSNKQRSAQTVSVGHLRKKRKSSNLAAVKIEFTLTPDARQSDEYSSAEEGDPPTSDSSRTNDRVNPPPPSTETSDISTERLDNIERTISTLDDKCKILMTTSLNMEKIVTDNNRLLKDLLCSFKDRPPAPIASTTMMKQLLPASTEEQLHTLCQEPDIMTMMQMVVEVSLSKTLVRMFKMLMTKQLAVQFSLTGHGKNREHTKLSFKKSPAYKLVEHAVMSMDKFRTTTRKDLQKSISNVFKNAPDWTGKKRRRDPLDCLIDSEFVLSEPCRNRMSEHDQDDDDDGVMGEFIETKFVPDSVPEIENE